MSESFQKANALFVDEMYQEALGFYDQAIQSEPQNAEYYVKRSACLTKLKKYTKASEDAKIALSIDPKNILAHLRKGVALFYLSEYESARSSFVAGLACGGSNDQFDTWIRKCDAEIENEEGASETPKEKVEEVQEQPQSSSSASPVVVEVPTPIKVEPVNPPLPVNVPAPFDAPPKPKVRHEWYQTPTHVTVEVYQKGVKKEDAEITFSEEELHISIKLSASSEYSLDLSLCDKISPQDTVVSFLSTKVEVRLKKANEGTKWTALERPANADIIVTKWDDSSSVNKHLYPTSAKIKKNWDSIVKNDEEEKLTGDAALNKVFQDIFARGSEEQKRAMMKSFVESGGTVLSTNWEDVGKRTVECTPPNGMEAHKWNE
eukprot:TRINITY_DN6409_c0_g1_i2.p1 TRINITY_DN6409_c0_g1~~TRINITY_DN6409_c0_g1_i2.p1  ORF type:complete len:376 (+),score=154.54 TRINITY_DN6409_c0_g1_i2:78-1205(+)